MDSSDDCTCTTLSDSEIEAGLECEVSRNMSKSMSKGKVLSKLLGVSEEEMKRNNALRKLGASEGIVQRSREIFKDVHKMELITKDDHVLGASQEQRKRSKGVSKVLGTTEEIIAEERARALGIALTNPC